VVLSQNEFSIPAFKTLLGPPLEHFYPSLQRHNSPANSTRELFKSSTDSASLLVSIKKNYFIWVRGSFGVPSQSGGIFEFLTNLTGPGRQSNEPFFWKQVIIRVYRALD